MNNITDLKLYLKQKFIDCLPILVNENNSKKLINFFELFFRDLLLFLEFNCDFVDEQKKKDLILNLGYLSKEISFILVNSENLENMFSLKYKIFNEIEYFILVILKYKN